MLAFAVELPDLHRVQAIPDGTLRGLATKLRAVELTPAFLARLARVGERLDDPLRAPMRMWNARRMREPAALAVRLFILHDAVAPEDARRILGDTTPWLDGGLLEEVPEGFVSRFHLVVAEHVYCFGDRPASHVDAIMPMCGATLDLVRGSMPRRRVRAALDLGCGAGCVGLLLSRAADRVVAVDISARALSFARVNAAINGIENVELRQGDLFETTRGGRFDLIVAHPPFLARDAGAPWSTFVHGGTRGDELSLRMLAGASSHLAPGGRAIVLADWPVVDGDALDARVRSAIGEASVDVLVLQSPSKNLDEYCAMHAAAEYPDLGAAFARAAMGRRDHIEKLGLRGIALAFVVLQPAEHDHGWTSLLAVRHVSDAPLTPEAIDRLVAARSIAHRGRDALGAARLRFPEGARRVEQRMPGDAPPAIVVQLPAGRPEWPAVLQAESAAIVARITESASVLDALQVIASERDMSLARTWDGVEQVVRDALLQGVLEVVPSAPVSRTKRA